MRLDEAVTRAQKCVPTLEDAQRHLQRVADAYAMAATAIEKAARQATKQAEQLERGTGLTGAELDGIAAGLPADLVKSLDAAIADSPKELAAARAALGDVDKVFSEVRKSHVTSWRG